MSVEDHDPKHERRIVESGGEIVATCSCGFIAKARYWEAAGCWLDAHRCDDPVEKKRWRASQ